MLAEYYSLQNLYEGKTLRQGGGLSLMTLCSYKHTQFSFQFGNVPWHEHNVTSCMVWASIHCHIWFLRRLHL